MCPTANSLFQILGLMLSRHDAQQLKRALDEAMPDFFLDWLLAIFMSQCACYRGMIFICQSQQFLCCKCFICIRQRLFIHAIAICNLYDPACLLQWRGFFTGSPITASVLQMLHRHLRQRVFIHAVSLDEFTVLQQ
mmetsp:Transcript_76844/g.146178  ORF Transcript_76844/g.146178 Transcript_76844/m.146178 type:complete len:136 (-) Transcript_76844:98-505(-)